MQERHPPWPRLSLDHQPHSNKPSLSTYFLHGWLRFPISSSSIQDLSRLKVSSRNYSFGIDSSCIDRFPVLQMQKKRSTKPKANGWNWIPEQKGNSSCKSLVNETLIYDIRVNYPVRNWNRPSPAIIIMQQQCHHRDLSTSSYLAGWSWFILNIKAKLQSTIPTVPRLQQVKLTFSKLTHKNNMIKILDRRILSYGRVPYICLCTPASPPLSQLCVHLVAWHSEPRGRDFHQTYHLFTSL